MKLIACFVYSTLSTTACPASKCAPVKTISQVEEQQRHAVKISILKELRDEIDLDAVYNDHDHPIPPEVMSLFAQHALVSESVTMGTGMRQKKEFSPLKKQDRTTLTDPSDGHM